VLHDARLWHADVALDGDQARMQLLVSALRGDEQGRTLNDTRVLLYLFGVRAIAVAYEPGIMQRVSEMRVKTPVVIEPDSGRVSGLGKGYIEFFAPRRASVANLMCSSRVDWLVGSGRPAGTPLGVRGDEGTLLVWFASFREDVMVPFELDEWERQCERWWKGWRTYHEEGSDGTDRLMDAAIPAGSADSALHWTPAPRESVCQLEETDLPLAIGRAVAAWAKAEHGKDRRTKGERGSRPYFREVLEWWVEGRAAAVRLRGLSCWLKYDDDDRAETQDCIFEFRLRKEGREWRVDVGGEVELSKFARPRLPRRRRWMSDWKATEIEPW
jgi:hypothetical protein